jgi:hypothetical protein
MTQAEEAAIRAIVRDEMAKARIAEAQSQLETLRAWFNRPQPSVGPPITISRDDWRAF